MTDYAGNARLAGAGGLHVAATAYKSLPVGIVTAPPEFVGELLAGNLDQPIPIPPGTSDPSSADSGNGVAVRASDMAGGQQMGQPKQDFFFVEKLLAVVLGDKVLNHGTEKHGQDPTMVQALDWFRINGIGACRRGHLADCGHATTGRQWWSMTG